MKIAAKSLQVDLTGLIPPKVSTLKFMENIQIRSILSLNNQQFCLVRSSSVLVYNQQLSAISKVIQLGFEIDQVGYLAKNDIFYAYQVVERQVISFTNDSCPNIKVLYNFNQNKVNIQFEWAPWVLAFQQSQKLALVRKLYGESLIVVFKATPQFEKIWQFKCNESSISKMDEHQYLVNFDETNNKFCLKFVVYNCDQKEKNQYKIENVEPNICKSVKLYEKIVQKSEKKKEKVWLKTAIGVNYKINGSGILLVNLLEGSNNHYELIAAITNKTSEINSILNASSIDRSLRVLQFRYIPQKKYTGHFLTNYQWNEFQNDLIITDDIQIQSSLQDCNYNFESKRLVTMSNVFKKEQISSLQKISHMLKVCQYKIIDKKAVYIHLLQKYVPDVGQSFANEVLKLL